MSEARVREIQRACAERYGIEPAQMCGPWADGRPFKKDPRREARRLSIYLSRTRTTLTYRQLATLFGVTKITVHRHVDNSLHPTIRARFEGLAAELGIGPPVPRKWVREAGRGV